MRFVVVVALVLACKSEKTEKQRAPKPESEDPMANVKRNVPGTPQDLPPEPFFTCEKVFPKAIREVMFPEASGLKGDGNNTPKFYECQMTTGPEESIEIEMNCRPPIGMEKEWITSVMAQCASERSHLAKKPGGKVEEPEVGRYACVASRLLENGKADVSLWFVPSKLDCVAKIFHHDYETSLELAKALDEIYTKATVSP